MSRKSDRKSNKDYGARAPRLYRCHRQRYNAQIEKKYFFCFFVLFCSVFVLCSHRPIRKVLVKLALGAPTKAKLLWGVAQKGGGVEGQSPRRAPQSAKAPIRVLFAKLFLALLSQEKALGGSRQVKGRGAKQAVCKKGFQKLTSPTLFFEAVGAKKSFKRNANRRGAAPNPATF